LPYASFAISETSVKQTFFVSREGREGGEGFRNKNARPEPRVIEIC
jgi:hypothetical protein